MKITLEQIPPEQPEELLIRCHDPNAPWAARIMAAVSPEVTITGYREDAAYCLPVRDLYYFEVVDGRSFLYAEKAVYECRLRLYEFEKLVEGQRFFRCVRVSNIGYTSGPRKLSRGRWRFAKQILPDLDSGKRKENGGRPSGKQCRMALITLTT